jgi:hypothetical protein
MSFEEKVTWVSALVTVLAVGWYVSVLGTLMGEAPVTEIGYQRPMLIAVAAMIGLTIAGTIVMSIGTAIGLEIMGRGSGGDVDRRDERDARIDARGDRVSYFVVSAVMIAVLAMAMLELPHFWIANGIFAAFVVAGLVGFGVKLAAYRRGF